eukprot:766395-Hanusia_phi.AAC.7
MIRDEASGESLRREVRKKLARVRQVPLASCVQGHTGWTTEHSGGGLTGTSSTSHATLASWRPSADEHGISELVVLVLPP